jgi:hypothetical protein
MRLEIGCCNSYFSVPGPTHQINPALQKNKIRRWTIVFFAFPLWNEMEWTLSRMNRCFFDMRLWDWKWKVAIPLCVDFPFCGLVGWNRALRKRTLFILLSDSQEMFFCRTCVRCFQSTQNQYLETWNIISLQSLDETEPSGGAVLNLPSPPRRWPR